MDAQGLDFGLEASDITPPTPVGATPATTALAASLAASSFSIEASIDDEDLKAEASKLRKECDPRQLLAAFVMKRTGDYNNCLFSGSITLPEFLKMCTIVLPLLGACPSKLDLNMCGAPIDHNATRVLAMRANLIVLQMSLTDIKPPVADYISTSTMARIMSGLMGAKSKANKDENDDIINWTINVGKFPPITVACPDERFYTVTDGAEHFIASLNAMYNTNYVLIDLPPLGTRLAHFLAANYSLSAPLNGEPKLVPLAALPKNHVEWLPPNEAKWANLLITEAVDLISQKKILIPTGMPVNQQPLLVMEYLVHQLFLHSRAKVDLVGKLLPSRIARLEKIVADDLKSVTDDLANARMGLLNLKLTKDDIARTENGGDIKAFRDENNNWYRKTRKATDIPKSDSVDRSGFAGPTSSVPYKTASLIEDNPSWNVNRLWKGVDAFGVSKDNLWQREVEKHFPKHEGGIKWYDLAASELPLGGKCEIRDVLGVQPGSGAGRFLCDDSAPNDPYEKLSVLAKAGYDAGFIKLMLGWGTDAPIATHLIHPAFIEFRKTYPFCDFRRFNPHSEEYFLIFSSEYVHAAAGVRWMKPLVPLPRIDNPDTDESAGAWKTRACTWRRIRCLEIYCSNHARSVGAGAGIGLVKYDPNGVFNKLNYQRKVYEMSFSETAVKGRIRGKDERKAIPLSADALKDLQFQGE